MTPPVVVLLFTCLGILILFATIMYSIVAYKIMKRKPHVYNLSDCRYWGHSIQLDVEADSPHSSRCLPNIEELKTISKIKAFGWMSNPYISKGDIVICSTFGGPDVKLKFTKVRYTDRPHDMFFAELKLID